MSIWSALGVQEAQAGPVSAFQLNSFVSNNANLYIGIEILVTTPQTVSFLGVIDTNNDSALNANVGVGIYSVPAGCCAPKLATHVVSAFVLGGTAVENIGARGAFFVDVPDITLSPGNYVIVADAGGAGEGFGGATTYTFQPGISYVNGWFGGVNFPGLGSNFTVTNQCNMGGCWPAGVFKVGAADTDTDSDGVNDEDDMCVGSAPDNINLNPNQYAQNSSFGSFEVGPNDDQSIVYDMTDTEGCTCKQIVELLGVGRGHLKKGCSPSVMEEFTVISAEPDRQAGIGKK